MRGRKPYATRKGEATQPVPPDALPRCPPHLSDVARKEWRRLARPLHEMGVLSVTDRAALAAYCQAWARWVEAEQHLQKGPPLLKTPSGYVQQSPWLAIANKQLEIMGRYMAELGLTPSARARLRVPGQPDGPESFTCRIVFEDDDGRYRDLRGNEVEDGATILLSDKR